VLTVGCGCAERRKKLATTLKKALPKSKLVEQYHAKAHAPPPPKKETS
jgi:hypothetical protein